MHAIRLHAFGPADNLTYETVADPVAGPGQVRIAVSAAGVHFIDTVLREGTQGSQLGQAELPTIPGREVAGTVDALGEGVDERWLGKRVVAHLGFVPGGYAELATAGTDRLHEIPENLNEEQAVAMIGTGRTTMGILRFAELTAEDIAVVSAAAGGIGTLLVQYAKNVGATVIGLAGGPAKVERVRDNGADLAVDYRYGTWPEKVHAFLAERGRDASIVFDGVGGAAGRTAVDLLGRGGRHLVFGRAGEGPDDSPLACTEEELKERGITSQGVLGAVMMEKVGGENPMRTLEAESLAEAAAGRLVPDVERFPLTDAAVAHGALETRRTMGKVVLIP